MAEIEMESPLSLESLAVLHREQEMAHPSKHWRARLLSSKTTGVLSCKWSPDDELIAAAYFDGGVRLWNPHDGTLVHTLYLSDTEDEENVMRGIQYCPKDEMPEACTTSLQWRPGTRGSKKQLLLVDTAGKISVFDVPGKLKKGASPCWTMQEDSELRSCDWLRDEGSQIAVGGYAQTISIYDVEASILVTALKSKLTVSNRITGHSRRIHQVRCATHDTNVILSAAWDNAVLLWDVRNGNVVRSFTGPGLVMNGGEPADLSTLGDMVVTAADVQGGDITLWDVGGRGIVVKIPCAFGRPATAKFSKDEASTHIAVGAQGMATCAFVRRWENRAAGEESRWTLCFTGCHLQPTDAPRADVWGLDWAHKSRRVCIGPVSGAVSILRE